MDVAGPAMDAAELARWTRFAAKGGIGKCTAVGDCVAEAAEDLMFLKNDEIVVLMQLQEENIFLGYCEGIVGRFHANDVHFHSKLKKPVMTKRSSVSASSISGKSTPTPSLVQDPGAYFQISPSPQPHVRYQSPPSPPPSRPSSREPIPRSASISSTTVSFSTSGSTSASFTTSTSPSSSSSTAPDRLPTAYSSDPLKEQPIITSSSTASVDTNVSGRSSTYLGSSVDGDGEDDIEGSVRRNRRSETTTVEMWPSSSPSSAISRRPINGSRLALAIHPPESEESEEERVSERTSSKEASDEEYEPNDGGWANVPATLPLQVVKLNSAATSIPPSPYQSFTSSSFRARNEDDESVQSRSRSSSLQHTESSSGAESESSDYPPDSNDHGDETARFSLPSEPRTASSASNDESTQERHSPRSISDSPRARSSSRPPSSAHESILYGDTANSLMHEESTRLSIAAPSLLGSDDGEVGIGLSLLQGMMEGDAEESDDDEKEHTTPSKASIASSSRRNSAVSVVRSLPPHDDWDGASDIYENYYRFSKFSAKSRSSTSTFASMAGSHNKSSASHNPQRGMPVPSTPEIPPMPVDRRPEAESSRSQKRRSVDSDASVYTQASKASSIDETQLSAQPTQARRPPPLELGGEPSPLLHTRWGSPLGSSSPLSSSAASQSFDARTPPASASSGSISPGGAASILRQRLEIDRGSPIGSYKEVEVQEDVQDGDGLGSRIVVEDDEEPPSPAIVDDIQYDYLNEGSDLDVGDEPATERPGHDSLAPLVIGQSLSPPQNPMNSTAPALTPTSISSASPLSTSTTTPVTPSSPPDLPTPPTPSTQIQQPQHQIPLSLSELRGYSESNSSPSSETAWDAPAQRTSIFLPHPNAPKPPPATGAAEGPMYTRAPPPPSQQRSENVVNIIKMSIGRSTVTRVMPTIYGRTELDLGSSTGPVRMVFSIDPLPPLSVPLPSQIPFRNGATPPIPVPSPRSATNESDAALGKVGKPESPQAPQKGTLRSVSSPPSALPTKSSPLASDRPTSVDPKPKVAIPRPNFFPRAGTSRPRSRSFSGFNTATTEISLPLERSREEGSKAPNAQKAGRSMSINAAPTQSLSAPLSPVSPSPSSPSPPPSLGKHASRSSLRSAHAPSPLSLPHNNSVLGNRPGLRSPTSPLALSPATNSSSNLATRPFHQLRQVTSRSTLNEPPNRPPITRGTVSESPIALSPVHTRNESLLSSPHDRPSLDSESMRVISPTPGSRESLRHKLSLPNLRRNQSRQSSSGSQDNETVQVQDMDFELIRPSLAQFQQASGRSSEDSLLGAPREASMDGRTSNLGGDAFRRTDSPAMSVSSAQAFMSSSSESSSMDAHRQRELKWISLIGTVPPAQAKKSKKVKKLLMDGSVPSSVRFLVWSHLTDGKAKGIPGVYAQLGKRARVGALSDIERDVQRCSTDHPQMQSVQVSLKSLLQAYLTMVPDVAYSVGLTLIAGHLLVLSPEEDAFWIFVSIMDSYLRPYFSSNTTQMEVDAALFSRALENNDAQVAKKVLLDMSINPLDLCRPWFTTLFVDALPPEYLNRVWDLFLYEGIPFLFRVALALFHSCRRQILEAINQESVFDVLNHPSPHWLPPSPDAFISLAYSLKVKDDDVRKQRIKMEAQVKRQTQTPRANPAASRTLSYPRI